MPLQVEAGHATEVGRRERNEDSWGIALPEGEPLSVKGALLAVADGVSGHSGGREAAEATIQGLLSDYYATPDTWEIPQALERVLSAINRWLLAQSALHRDYAGMATTLSAVVLRGNRYWLVHVGDSRVYLLRNGRLERLTQDHVWERPGMQHVLKRAVGLDQHLVPDYADAELQAGDVLLLATDGVWEGVGDPGIHEILQLYDNPRLAAEALVKKALTGRGRDNATAVVVRVRQVAEGLRDLLAAGRHLAVPPRAKIGQLIDDFEIQELLHESRVTLLYRARHKISGQMLVLKTLNPALNDDPEACEALLAEEWLGKRVRSHYFPQVMPLTGEERHFLYYVMTYHDGATLQQHLQRGRHFSCVEAVQIGIRLLKGLAALHRLNVLHRDIKPANLHLADDGKLRILDLGVAASGLNDNHGAGHPGTPSFIAPELFDGAAASPQSDLYAIGVTLYHLLTRKYPYGEIEPFQRPRFVDPVSPRRYRPDIPVWLENALLKAVVRDPRLRFETAEEFLLALEHGEHRQLAAPGRTPLAARDPLRTWQGLALASLVFNLILLYLLAVT